MCVYVCSFCEASFEMYTCHVCFVRVAIIGETVAYTMP